MFENRSYSLALVSFVAAMASVGCQGGEEFEGLAGIAEAPGSGEGAPLASPESADEADAILAEIEVGERSTVRFIDEGVTVPGGGVGVLLIGAPRLSASYKKLELTPLELYLAIAPGGDAPELLREDHRAAVAARGLASAEPRAMSVEGGALVLNGDPRRGLQQPTFDADPQTTSASDCTTILGNLFMYWATSWCYATAPNAEYCDTDVGLSGNNTMYTGSGGERWLGACNDSNSSNASLSWSVLAEYYLGYPWQTVAGTSITLPKDHSVAYHSSGVGYNYAARVTAGSTVMYQMGAARD